MKLFNTDQMRFKNSTLPKVDTRLLTATLENDDWTGNAVEYIVGAVNSHEGLLKVAKLALEALHEVSAKLPGEEALANYAMHDLKQAIDKAEGRA